VNFPHNRITAIITYPASYVLLLTKLLGFQMITTITAATTYGTYSTQLYNGERVTPLATTWAINFQTASP